MLEWLLNIDQAVFSFINGSLANPVTDLLIPIITNDNVLRVIYALALVILLVVGRKRFIWVVVFSALAVALTDQSSSAWLKPAFERLRPCQVMDVNLLVGCGAGFSFPSSHAANLFGQAIFFGLLYKKYLPHLLVFAFLVGVSRIFVGVHYPLDIIGGAILGASWGFLAAGILRELYRRNKLRPEPVIHTASDNRHRDIK
jgi:undecaprenyl-diphosphatase